MVKMIDVISSISVLLFLYAAWTDFRTWKIPNTIVLALVTLYALRAVAVMLGSEDVGAALFASSGIGGDVGAGLLMFMLGWRSGRSGCLVQGTPSFFCRSAFLSDGMECCRFRFSSSSLASSHCWPCGCRCHCPSHTSPFSCASRKFGRAGRYLMASSWYSPRSSPWPCPLSDSSCSYGDPASTELPRTSPFAFTIVFSKICFSRPINSYRRQAYRAHIQCGANGLERFGIVEKRRVASGRVSAIGGARMLA